MTIQRKLNLSKDVKIWALHLQDKAPGFAVGSDFSSMTGGDSFVSCYQGNTTIGGDKINMQISSGGQKWMGGLFKNTPFPIDLFPFMPQHMFDPEILLSIITFGVPIMEGIFRVLMPLG